MAKTRVVLKNKGFRELRTSSKARKLVQSEAKKVADRAGPGFEVLPEQSPRNRAHAVVAPVTAEAVRMNAKDNTLLKALAGGAPGVSLYTSKSGKTSLRSEAEIANYTRGRR